MGPASRLPGTHEVKLHLGNSHYLCGCCLSNHSLQTFCNPRKQFRCFESCPVITKAKNGSTHIARYKRLFDWLRSESANPHRAITNSREQQSGQCGTIIVRYKETQRLHIEIQRPPKGSRPLYFCVRMYSCARQGVEQVGHVVGRNPIGPVGAHHCPCFTHTEGTRKNSANLFVCNYISEERA